MDTNAETWNPYRNAGFATRAAYIKHLAEEFDVDLSTVVALANMLGPSEDFDGLVTTLEDIAW